MSGQSAAEVEEQELQGFASDTLTVLEFEANGQTILPPLRPNSTVLTAVLASFNRLGAVPLQLAQHGTTLKKLHLGCNDIGDESVAAVLPALTRLTDLCLEGNRLSVLPAAIGRLLSLKELWLHGNQLQSLPEELGRCSSLTVLQAHHNLLTELPAALAHLTRLQGLYLQSNRLSGLAALNKAVLRHLPLQNVALGLNRFDLAEAFDCPGARVGLGWNAGSPPPPLQSALTEWVAVTDQLFEPACRGGPRSDVRRTPNTPPHPPLS